ncbi:EscF/YscF/HrpA family type III secretion system needle major subunit [Rhizobium oryzicola]|uniref:EscF/YscF/HrpA family type III secretion system needle major subunit n=1 Tax=Rhizobium oryzicola TaxID=1232668 RepID=A0ABT8SXP8_9HYPH|nr:EscF/YscF/HrpA family type III secretion system needle major subunit [Rhizobium oryzicola]MDO1583195.1 EscF/YscF/HrpA family type III secretion system needle major subunit [Rhizobium oryzicola]
MASTFTGLGTQEVWAAGTKDTSFDGQTSAKYVIRDGFDLIWSQKQLGDQMQKIEGDIRDIEQNANLSDTEKMFSMQMAMNTWSAVSNLRTNVLKSVADTLKSIARNVS